MKSQNISFLLEINLEYLKKILCLLVSNQECAKIFIPFASCSMLKKMQFCLQFQLLQSMEPRHKLNKLAAKGIILFHSILFMKIILKGFFLKYSQAFSVQTEIGGLQQLVIRVILGKVITRLKSIQENL